MRKPSNRQADGKTSPRDGRVEASKKPYRSPRTVEYGSLSKLALTTKGGGKNDGGGEPASKA